MEFKEAEDHLAEQLCENKYIAYGKACQEAIFMNQLLEELFGVPTSAVVYGNNQGALFLVKNGQVSP